MRPPTGATTTALGLKGRSMLGFAWVAHLPTMPTFMPDSIFSLPVLSLNFLSSETNKFRVIEMIRKKVVAVSISTLLSLLSFYLNLLAFLTATTTRMFVFERALVCTRSL